MMKKARVIAYYLPQFHPTEENNKWWGPGFTEWTNVAKAKPLFKGHVQPHVPSTLGFYDLRLAEVRSAQAELAKRSGIDAFFYCHYWFGNGVQLLEKPLEWIIETGEPDFPFCLGWANHSWEKKRWNSDVSRLDRSLLMEQTYPGQEDFKAHFYKMLKAFKDRRYYKIDGKNLFLIYVVKDIPQLDCFIETWQSLAMKNNLPPFYFIGHVNNLDEIQYCQKYSFDQLVYENLITARKTSSLAQTRMKSIISSLIKRPLSVMNYEQFINRLDYSPINQFNILPTIYSNWDTTPRLSYGGEVLMDAKPELFYNHVKSVIDLLKERPIDKRIVFLKSWNEWAEGNYVEPDMEYGEGRLMALQRAILGA